MKERHISQRKEGKRQNKKKVVEKEKEKKKEKVGTRIRRGLKASRRIKNCLWFSQIVTEQLKISKNGKLF